MLIPPMPAPLPEEVLIQHRDFTVKTCVYQFIGPMFTSRTLDFTAEM